MKNRITILFLTLLMLYLYVPADACDMITVAGIISEAQQKYAEDFLKSRSGSRSNNDGYGVAWFASKWQAIYKTGKRRWYGDGDYEPLDELKDWEIGESDKDETLMLHARNATAGYGNHPFLLEMENESWAFMHNGNLTKELYAYMLEYLGEMWFEVHRSNWTQETDEMVDSEVFFHYLMSRYSSGFTIKETLEDIMFLERNQTEKSILNFILSDGTILYAFRNSTKKDFEHKMSWKLEYGCLTIKTERKIGKMLEPGEMLIFEDGKLRQLIIDD
ncbi:MAG: class II glutamine amidotransferase [Candidatus Cloacimonetes bacterium]|nr:class II glutamine amidotransferase [Candidatus Cloacimonadota bacterium]